jgi:hypothetical protein
VRWRHDGGGLAGASGAAEHRRAVDKMSNRLMEVFKFVNQSNDAVTATEVARALTDMNGDTAGKYLRRLADNGYIVKFGRGQFLGTPTHPEVSEVSETDDGTSQGAS